MKALALVVFTFALTTYLVAQTPKTVQITVLDSYADSQSFNVPGRLVCLPGQYGPTCGAVGASTATTYSIRVKATLVGSNTPIWLGCQLVKRGDEKHCSRLGTGTYPAEPKGKDKVTIYAWSNPLYRGDMSKANKLEFTIGGREPDPSETTLPVASK